MLRLSQIELSCNKLLKYSRAYFSEYLFLVTPTNNNVAGGRPACGPFQAEGLKIC